MYVCVCNAITEEQVRQAIAEGADSLDELCAVLGLGDQCGKCLDYVRHHCRIRGAATPDTPAGRPPGADYE